MPSAARPKHIIISRTDAIGDVVLTLPLAGILRKNFPEVRITLLGKAYTRAVIEACPFVDAFWDLEDFFKARRLSDAVETLILHVFPVAKVARKAKLLGIRWRVGTSSRLYHWFTCNRLVRLSRKNSDLHEAQLNAKLLAPLGIQTGYSLEELSRALSLKDTKPLPDAFAALLTPGKCHVILHPKSQGSAREWGLDNFLALIRLLDPARFQVFISGTAQDKESLYPLLSQAGNLVTDITGMMTLPEFMSFIAACDMLVANSTGPLHIAGALGKVAVGIYPPIRPMHPGRWVPLGIKSEVLALNKDCSDCSNDPAVCKCIKSISPLSVSFEIQKFAQVT